MKEFDRVSQFLSYIKEISPSEELLEIYDKKSLDAKIIREVKLQRFLPEDVYVKEIDRQFYESQLVSCNFNYGQYLRDCYNKELERKKEQQERLDRMKTIVETPIVSGEISGKKEGIEYIIQ